MGLPELKQKIQMQIENADERVLQMVASFFDTYLNEEASDNTPFNSMTLLEKKGIDEALKQVANKQTISHELVMEATKKRYPNYFNNEN
ncbi:hypothetical protein [Flavobacterium restrictum]|uniref:Uncharacterized protein n=1 Tax=Flavobacterium restrictum TaxID=2594428 RepID=A0A553E920_9FLAO|nr:hypothetical protein [Flavobacterium restrictum]TRX41526.1 hypothetical protein FNW21_05380 [Flavobacterium restrictum]